MATKYFCQQNITLFCQQNTILLTKYPTKSFCWQNITILLIILSTKYHVFCWFCSTKYYFVNKMWVILLTKYFVMQNQQIICQQNHYFVNKLFCWQNIKILMNVLHQKGSWFSFKKRAATTHFENPQLVNLRC